MAKHAYLPKITISDKGSAFISHVNEKAADVHGITLKHDTTNHAQTNWMLYWSYASFHQTLKIETGECRSLWHKYVIIAVFISTHLTTQVLAVNREEFVMNAFLSSIWSWAFVHRKHPCQINKLFRMSWSDRNDLSICPKESHASLQ